MSKVATRQTDLFPFTDFPSVDKDTRISSLNLNWRERDLPEHIRTKHVHRLHPYLGKFIPQLVEIFLRKYKPKLVVDPFCGSGTTLVEAQALGIDSFGSDISEFNCLLSRVKTAEYALELLESEVRDILYKAFGDAPQKRLLEERALYCESSYLKSWFAPKALGELLRYRDFINGYQYQDVLKIILSRAARSARLTTHFDLDFPRLPQTEPYYCYKHSRTCQPTTDAMQFLRRYSHDTVRRIREFTELRKSVKAAKAEVVWGDSRSIAFPKCDLVITSPPYVGLIDYHEQHRYAYELLGLKWNAEEEIGAASNGNSGKAINAYVSQMEQVFNNVSNSLRRSGKMVIVVHDRKGLYRGLAEKMGFRIEEEIHRQVNRRTGRRADDFFESIFVWKR